MSHRVSLRRGFTLVELLIVIVILAVLAAIAIPRFMNSGTRSKTASLRSDLKLVRNAIQTFSNDTGTFPATLDDLAGSAAPANGVDGTSGASKAIKTADWHGPYMTAIPTDPVSGNALTYSITAGTVGKVSSSASGNDDDGTAYSSY